LARKVSEKQKLAEHRVQIREITKSILDLVNARQHVSLKVAASKRTMGLPIENREVEEALIADMMQYARDQRLDEDLAESIVSKLTESSKDIQRKDTYSRSVKQYLKSNRIKKVSIVGAGRMGTWFAKYFLNLRAEVNLLDLDYRKARSIATDIDCDVARTHKEVVESDLVIVAVPISRTPLEIKKIVNSVRKTHSLKVIEISSVKKAIEKSGLLRNTSLPKNVELFSIHPLFGPNTRLFSTSSIVQVNHTNSKFIQNLFPTFLLHKMNWKDHDKLAAWILSLPHALALVFARTLAQNLHKNPKAITGPSYESMLEFARKVLQENPDVYFEIQSTNPFSKKTLKEAARSLNEIEKLLNSRSQFKSFFKTTAKAV
jgi:prephenate dehydrogenase/chorismate mutase